MVNIHFRFVVYNLLLIFYHCIWMCHFDTLVSLGVYSQRIKLSSSYEMFSSCFWCHLSIRSLFTIILFSDKSFSKC